MTGEWEEEIFFPKRRDSEDYVVNTVVRKTACRILSFSLKIDQGKSAQLIRSLISPSLVVKSHGGDKIFIIDSYIVIVAIKFNRDACPFFLQPVCVMPFPVQRRSTIFAIASIYPPFIYQRIRKVVKKNMYSDFLYVSTIFLIQFHQRIRCRKFSAIRRIYCLSIRE